MNINISNIITDGRLESNTRLSPVEIGYEGFKKVATVDYSWLLSELQEMGVSHIANNHIVLIKSLMIYRYDNHYFIVL